MITKTLVTSGVRSACETCLHEFVSDVPGIVMAQLMTADGFEIASHIGPMGAGIAPKLAAMGSSLWALSQAVSASTQIGESRNLVVEGSKGHVVLMAVPDTRPALSLLVVTNPSATLGQTLWTTKNTALAISKLIPAN